MDSKNSFTIPLLILLNIFLCATITHGFRSDELLLDDEEFGLEGGFSVDSSRAARSDSPPSYARQRTSDPGTDSDSKIQFQLEHAFGDSEFASAGIFSARLKTSSHGGQTLTKLRFSRNAFSESEKENFKLLLKGDDFYRIRLPSNALSPPGSEYIFSSVKARCLIRDTLDEHFVIHMEGINILAVNYGSPGSCQYPRQMKLPSKWSFKSHTVLKNSDQAPRTPIFMEAVVGENSEGEEMKPPEKSFWAKYWMYLIPLGLIAMNAITQAMNMPEEQAGQQGAAGRGQAPTVRRR